MLSVRLSLYICLTVRPLFVSIPVRHTLMRRIAEKAGARPSLKHLYFQKVEGLINIILRCTFDMKVN